MLYVTTPAYPMFDLTYERGLLFKIMFLCLGVFLLAFAAGQAFRNARRLDRRIAEFKAEQKELEEQGRTLPPYMAFGGLDAGEEQKRRKEEEKKRRNTERQF